MRPQRPATPARCCRRPRRVVAAPRRSRCAGRPAHQAPRAPGSPCFRQRPGRSRPQLRRREVPVGSVLTRVRWSSLLLPCQWHASERRGAIATPSSLGLHCCHFTECRTDAAAEPQMPPQRRSVLHATTSTASIAAPHVHECVGRYAKEPRVCPWYTPICMGSRCCARDRKSTRLNSSHVAISYAVFCLKKKKKKKIRNIINK